MQNTHKDSNDNNLIKPIDPRKIDDEGFTALKWLALNVSELKVLLLRLEMTLQKPEVKMRTVPVTCKIVRLNHEWQWRTTSNVTLSKLISF